MALPSDLDAEHAEILARLTLFRDRVLAHRPHGELRSHLVSLHDALTAHLRVEQDAMRAARWSGVWEHTDEHLILWHTFLRLMDACEASNFDVNCGMRMFTTLSGMLQRHVEKHDRPFFLFMEQKSKKK